MPEVGFHALCNFDVGALVVGGGVGEVGKEGDAVVGGAAVDASAKLAGGNE